MEAEAEDGIEETVMEVVVEAGGETTGAREAPCLPTTAGKMSLRIATMEEAEVEMIGEVVEVAVEVSGTAMTGTSLCQGMRGWKRNSSTLATVPLGSTLTGER